MNRRVERRAFLAGSVAALGATVNASLGADEAAAPATGSRQYYELRILRLQRGPMVARAEKYLAEALIPAMGRLGAGPIGVFNVAVGPQSPSLFVLVTHPSAESAVTASSKLIDDPHYREAAADFMKAPPTDPPYLNIEAQLLAAASFMPALEVPAGVAKKEPRLFELRTYRSHSKAAARKKLEMFGPGGELAIFRKAGLAPVFFGETLYGPLMPSLTYMVVFPDDAGRQKAWSAFGGDPDWHKLSTTPGYTDPEIVADISNLLLRPTSYSQI